MIGFSMVGVFAYSSSASITLNTNQSSARSTDIGYGYSANASAKNNASSGAWMKAAIWGSYKGAIYPWTEEASTNIQWGKNGKITDSQDLTSVYRLELTPNYRNHVSGSGTINLD